MPAPVLLARFVEKGCGVEKRRWGAAHGERKKKVIGLRGEPFVGDFPGAASIMGAQHFEFLLCKVYLQS